ncbi:MAG: hypothetical protein ACHQK9_19735 [Reyranellales bacterium]
MMTRLAVLTLVLISVAGVAQAQSRTPLGADGRPYVGSSDWHAGPGDYARERAGPQASSDRTQAMSPRHDRDRHEATFKDEYGFRYDARGDRLDARGNIISPQTR